MAKSEIELAESTNLMLAYLCVKDTEGLNSKVEVLDKFGLEDKQIAMVCSVVVQSVRNARAQYKKAKKSSKKGGK